MNGYKVPFSEAKTELTEKKSRFIGHIFKVETVEKANEILKAMQKQYWDASHVVYAYALKGGVMRMSDDGEPQGTAGMPTLEVLKKEEVFDILCVTVRYFGGTLLGAGGLTRAYGRAAKLALDEAGVAVMQPYLQVEIDCPYNLLEIVRKRFDGFEASEEGADFSQQVKLTLFMPRDRFEAFRAEIIDCTSGTVLPLEAGERLFAKRLK